MKLTDGYIRTARLPATGRLEISDDACRGLELRITAAGAKSWSFRFRDPTSGRVCRATIGSYPDIGLAKARDTADAMRAKVAAGGNPAKDKRRARVESATQSFEHLAGRYLEEHARRRKRSHATDDRNLRLHVLPKWRNRNYRAIRRADVIELLEGLVAAGKPILANRVQSLVSTIFGFALDADLVESNPCHRLRPRGVEHPRNRILSDDEIRLFWHGIVAREVSKRTGLGLRLALLTGCRVGEIAGLSRQELEHIDDPDRAAWLIPGARTKNSRDHLVPLLPMARATILDLFSMIGSAEPYLLPTRSSKRVGPMRSNTLTQSMDNSIKWIDDGSEGAGTWKAEPPTPHDLRRTVETRMAGLRIPKEYRDRVLGHLQGDVGSKHYNRHDYEAEKRDALFRWEAELSAIIDPKPAKVIPFTKGRQR